MKTERTRLRRAHERGSYDAEIIYKILDSIPMCHIGFVDSFGTPAVMPTLHWREGDHIYWHASSAARSLRAMDGKPVSLSVAEIDGYVMGRSALHHSVNFRSVVIYGTAQKVDDTTKESKLWGMIEHFYPGRWDKLRAITSVELKQTTVFGMPIEEASAKIRDAGVIDDEADLDFACWSGVVPITRGLGAPIEDEHNQTGTPIGADVTEMRFR